MYEIDLVLVRRARENFAARGESIAEWARINGFNLQVVYRLLSGKSKALRGQSHHIAVRLGIKTDENTRQ
jgi:gp16 family phage-associated protein